MKAWYGDAATKDNDWAYDYLPKLDKLHDMLQVFEDMHQGKINGYVAQGFNPLSSFPNKKKIGEALAKLKFLVVIDPLATETSRFWEHVPEFNEVDTKNIETTVFRLPSTCFAEEDGSLVSSSRVLQWHWKGADPPGDAMADTEIVGNLFTRLRALYRKEGGAFPDPIVNLSWPYRDPLSADAGRDREGVQRRARSSTCRTRPTRRRRSRRPASSCRASACCATTASTACGCWIFSRLVDAGRQPDGPSRQHRHRHRQHAELGVGMAGEPTHHLQPRERRSVGQAVGSEAQGDRVGRRRSTSATTCPTTSSTNKPDDGVGPFIMNPEGRRALLLASAR